MDMKAIRYNLAAAKRCLGDAENALDDGQLDMLVTRLALVAQYVSLCAHHMDREQPGVDHMVDVWPTAAKASDASIRNGVPA